MYTRRVRNHLEKENQDTEQPYKRALRVLCEPDNVEYYGDSKETGELRRPS